jgi:sugar O-acyltransferase (sialic acid O-acetyltransferase NeuD family)
MKSVLIYGAGQVAQVFAEYLEDNRFEVAGFVVDAEFLTPDKKTAPPRIATYSAEHIEVGFPPERYHVVIGMSFRGLNKPRSEKYAEMMAKGYEPLTFVDRNAFVSASAVIRPGSFVMDENTVQPHTRIGTNTILWSGSHVGHHTTIGDNVFIASHAVISGSVEIGDYCFIGVNATVRDGVKIGPRCVIGAGALILSDCEEGGVYSPGGTERSRVPSSRLRNI